LYDITVRVRLETTRTLFTDLIFLRVKISEIIGDLTGTKLINTLKAQVFTTFHTESTRLIKKLSWKALLLCRVPVAIVKAILENINF